MREVISIEANLVWAYFQDPKSGNWIGLCEPLKLTVEADALPELHESMTETMDALLSELLSSGDLEKFLHEQGWKAMSPIPRELGRDVFFDVPLNTRRVAPGDLSEAFCNCA